MLFNVNQNAKKNYGSITCKTCQSMFNKPGPRSLYCAPACKPGSYDRICKRCGGLFNTRDPRATLCSRSCHADTMRGVAASMKRKRVDNGGIGWHLNVPQILIDSTEKQPVSWLVVNGYIRYYWKSHPKSDQSTGAISEHRAVAYVLWGDGIDGMHIDHKNTDRSDNRPENLQLLTKSQHMKKTALKDSDRAFGQWVKEEHPDLFEEWRLLKIGINTPQLTVDSST